MEKALIVMQSDFGSDSGLVSCMHGVCKSIDRELEIYDITHDLPAFDIRSASATLQYVVPCWPSGTVFVSVVDPGVGTSRKASVAKLKNGSFVVTPDNGALTYLDKMIGIEAIREINEVTNRRNETRDISVFHGRDLFSYCAAKLAAHLISFEEVGPEYPVETIIKHPIHQATVSAGLVETQITGFDPFGSAELSVSNTEFLGANFSHGDNLQITITTDTQVVFECSVLYEKSFGFVPLGEEIIFNDLASFVTLGCNQASFAKKHHINSNLTYKVIIKN